MGERDVELLKPVIWEDGSDSTSLDNAFELLVRSGRDPVHALMMLLPRSLGAHSRFRHPRCAASTSITPA